jgi:hypothetical protein
MYKPQTIAASFDELLHSHFSILRAQGFTDAEIAEMPVVRKSQSAIRILDRAERPGVLRLIFGR